MITLSFRSPSVTGVVMVLRVPNWPFPILFLAYLLLLSSHVFAQPAVPFPSSEEPPVLAPKLQKELGKALEALRADKPAEARSHLDAVYRSAPGDADANFLFGIYSAEMNDWVHAKSYWEKVLVLSPNHLSALLSLGRRPDAGGRGQPGDGRGVR